MRIIVLVLIFHIVTACGHKKDREDFGLTLIEINLPDEKVSDFISDFRGDIPYKADIRINGQENQGIISPAGASSISMYKKSLDVKIQAGGRAYKGLSFRLSAQKTDLSMLKSIIAFEYYERIGLIVPEVEPVVVYFNGKLWGLYIKIERISEKFFETRNLDVDLAYKADNGANFYIKNALYPNSVFDVRVGEKNFEPIIQITKALDNTNDSRNIQLLDRLIDFDSIRKLNAGMALMNHWDSMANNFHLYRIRQNRKFQALPWDLDATFDLSEHPYSYGHLTELNNNKLFQYAVQKETTAHFTNLRNWLTSDFNPATLDAIAAPAITQIREAYVSDPILGARGLTIDSEYSRLRTDAISWWSSLDQELTNRGF